MIFGKIYRGQIFPIQVLQGEAIDSAVVKKIWLDSVSGWQRYQGFTDAAKSASAVLSVGVGKIS